MHLFVDTSGWVAYYDKHDQYHQAIKQAVFALQNTSVVFTTTDYVLDETITLLLYHAGKHQAIAFFEAVKQSKNVQIIRINHELWEQAWQLFKTHLDKQWAFTDCTSFVVMRDMNIWQVLGFDHHFEQAGFQLWPQ